MWAQLLLGVGLLRGSLEGSSWFRLLIYGVAPCALGGLCRRCRWVLVVPAGSPGPLLPAGADAEPDSLLEPSVRSAPQWPVPCGGLGRGAQGPLENGAEFAKCWAWSQGAGSGQPRARAPRSRQRLEGLISKHRPGASPGQAPPAASAAAAQLSLAGSAPRAPADAASRLQPPALR